MMKLLLAFALFFLTFVEGNLRGDLIHDDERDLKKCTGPNCKPASPPTPTPPTPTLPPPTPPTPAPPTPTPPTPASAVRFDTCGVTSYQSTTNAKTVPCFQASDCANYKPKFGTTCCLATRCICGSDADANPCANFAPTTGSTTVRIPGSTSPGVTVPTVTVPTVSSPP